MQSDPDPVGSVYYWVSWIRIRILVKVLDPDPYIEYTDPQHWVKVDLNFITAHY